MYRLFVFLRGLHVGGPIDSNLDNTRREAKRVIT